MHEKEIFEVENHENLKKTIQERKKNSHRVLRAISSSIQLNDVFVRPNQPVSRIRKWDSVFLKMFYSSQITEGNLKRPRTFDTFLFR